MVEHKASMCLGQAWSSNTAVEHVLLGSWSPTQQYPVWLEGTCMHVSTLSSYIFARQYT